MNCIDAFNKTARLEQPYQVPTSHLIAKCLETKHCSELFLLQDTPIKQERQKFHKEDLIMIL